MGRGITPRRPSRSGRHESPRASPRALPITTRANSAPKKLRAPKPGAIRLPRRAAKSSGYDPRAPERVTEILKRLEATYPAVTCALAHNNAWELLVATILSAQCTDVRVNMVTPTLFKKYRTVQALAAAAPEQIEPDIRSTGFFRNKSKSLVGAAKKLVEDFGGEVPDDMEQLLSLPGGAR